MSGVANWCHEAERLRARRTEIITGEAVSESQFGEDRIKFTKADLGQLDKLIAEAEDKCAAQMSAVKPRRRRFAMGVRIQH